MFPQLYVGFRNNGPSEQWHGFPLFHSYHSCLVYPFLFSYLSSCFRSLNFPPVLIVCLSLISLTCPPVALHSPDLQFTSSHFPNQSCTTSTSPVTFFFVSLSSLLCRVLLPVFLSPSAYLDSCHL